MPKIAPNKINASIPVPHSLRTQVLPWGRPCHLRRGGLQWRWHPQKKSILCTNTKPVRREREKENLANQDTNPVVAQYRDTTKVWLTHINYNLITVINQAHWGENPGEVPPVRSSPTLPPNMLNRNLFVLNTEVLF